MPGGGLRTEEWPVGSGFLHNTHSFYHRGVTRMPWYAELELERHGAHYLEPDLNVAMLLPDGRSLTWWTDFERTADSFAQFSRRDADTLRRWREAFLPIVTKILEPEAQAPPLSAPERRRRLSATGRGPPATRNKRLFPTRVRAARIRGTQRCRPASCSSTACAKSIRARPASATTSRRCWPPAARRKCASAARPD